MAVGGQEPAARSIDEAGADAPERGRHDLPVGTHLADVLDALPTPVLALDDGYAIYFANRPAEDLLGYRAGELAGVPLQQLSETAAMQLQGLSRRETPRQILCRLTCKDGRSLQLRIQGRALRRGRPEALLLLSEGRESRPDPAATTGSSQLATLGQIAAGLAQELEQPLSVIRMSADNTILMVEDGETDPRFLRGQLGLISGQSQRMARILEHLRHFARIERIDPVSFDVSDSVRTALALMERDFRRSGIRSLISLPYGAAIAFGLPLRLEQVLVNLFINARDAILREPGLPPAEDPATPAGRQGRVAGDVRVAVTVLPGVTEGAGCVEIRVSDTGPGIPDRYLGRIFDPFFTTKPPGSGTGLGLSICAALVSDMGGSIAARNGEGGAEFVVLMPVAAPPADRV
ncbi:ATP-binding protein [Marinibaculum pumilum]|uniref:histidine kinase n=1 Tax=Marinibaculum pumilum TaxID=1766165 RepID=A0ABV7L3Z6_9PROT